MSVPVVQDFIYALSEFESALYAARASGLYRSTDKGQSWHNAIESIQTEPMQTAPVVITSLLSAAQGLFAGSVGGLFKTTDAEGWQAVPLRRPAPTLSALAQSSDKKTLFASSLEDGVFRSEDNGQSWTAWNMGLFDLHCLALAVQDDAVYAGTETGLYVSHNDAKSWEWLETPFDDAVLSLMSRNGKLYAGTESQGLYVFKDDWCRLELAEGSVNQLLDTPDTLLVLVDDTAYKSEGNVFNKMESLDNISCLGLTNKQKLLVGFGNGTVRWEEV